MASPPRTAAGRPTKTVNARPPAGRPPSAAARGPGQGDRRNDFGSDPGGDGARRAKTMVVIACVIALILVGMFQRAVCLLLIVGLVPTMIAALIDDSPGQNLLRTITPLNLATTIPFVIQIWRSRDSLDQVGHLLSSVGVWIALYSAALFGWVLYSLAPAIIQTAIQGRIDRRRRALNVRQQELREEWGDPVADSTGIADRDG